MFILSGLNPSLVWPALALISLKLKYTTTTTTTTPGNAKHSELGEREGRGESVLRRICVIEIVEWEGAGRDCTIEESQSADICQVRQSPLTLSG